MSRLPQGQPLFALFWRLYIVLGLISIAVGGLLLLKPGLFFAANRPEYGMAQKIGAVFLLFGVLRIGGALFQLRRLSRSQPR